MRVMFIIQKQNVHNTELMEAIDSLTVYRLGCLLVGNLICTSSIDCSEDHDKVSSHEK